MLINERRGGEERGKRGRGEEGERYKEREIHLLFGRKGTSHREHSGNQCAEKKQSERKSNAGMQ